jgi:hypothetical protein
MKAERLVFDILKRCRGREQAMSAPQIARKVGINERGVRDIISRYHETWDLPGYLVCAPGVGFFLADEQEQVERDLLTSLRQKHATASRHAVKECLAIRAGFSGIVKNVRRASR